jgi:MSHA biogenesis protein MshJ
VKARWQAWSARFAALSLRERAMVAGATIFGIGIVGYSIGVEPALLKIRNAEGTVQSVQNEVAPLQAQLAVLKAQGSDPDAPNRARLERLRQQIAAAGQRLTSFEAGMVPPQKMQGFLEGLLSRNRNIELLGLKTLPVTQVGATDEKKPGPGAAAAGQAPQPPAEAGEGIYQHGVEIELAGSYNDLLNYLTELERMPQRVMWNRVELKVDKYPRNILTLRIYTLSLDRKWLVV